MMRIKVGHWLMLSNSLKHELLKMFSKENEKAASSAKLTALN